MKNILLATALLVQAFNMAFGAENTTMREMQDYIESLPENCHYEDGYVCSEASDINFYQQVVNNQLVHARYLQAWSAAYQGFIGLPELTDKQKNLLHYKIGFAETEQDYVVYFSPLRMPYIENGQPQGVSNVTYGQAVKFWVNKTTGKVSKHQFLK